VTQPLSFAQEWAGVLTPAGVVLGAGIAIAGQQLTNRANRKAQRAHDLFDKQTDACVAAIRVLFAMPSYPTTSEIGIPSESKAFVKQLEKWIDEFTETLAPLQAYCSDVLANSMRNAQALMQEDIKVMKWQVIELIQEQSSIDQRIAEADELKSTYRKVQALCDLALKDLKKELKSINHT
jgi:hypothetical protein